jgi:predicted nucleic acid-binding Zn ribbon protein
VVGQNADVPWEPLPTSRQGADPTPVGEELDRFVKGLGGPSARTVGGVFSRWAEIVGEQVAAHTRPLSMREGALQVAVDDPAWAPQLRFLEAQIVDRLAEVVGPGEITRIEVRVRPEQTGKNPSWTGPEASGSGPRTGRLRES